MACNTETKEIGNHEYSVTQWPATKSMIMKVRLIKTFGATIAKIASQVSNDSKKDGDKADANALSEGLSLLFQNNSPEEVVNLIKECIVGVACDDKIITNSSFDMLFSGDDQLEAYKVFLFILKVNYANLMKGQLATRLLAKVQEKL